MLKPGFRVPGAVCAVSADPAVQTTDVMVNALTRIVASPFLGGEAFGGDNGIRTHNHQIRSPPLYR